MRSRRLVAVLALTLGVPAALAGCTDDADPGPTPPTTPAVVDPVNLTFGVWGAPDEIAAYQDVVDAYNDVTVEAEVTIEPFDSHAELVAALDGGDVPDVFLVDRGDLGQLRERELNQPIGDLLDERNVDFGDGYSRIALEAFAADRDLQCMPYGISPLVVYYNRALVDFDRMARRGLDVPALVDSDGEPRPNPTWTFEQFQVAAEFASRPRREQVGFHVPATVRGLAPYIYTAGGSIFDDDEDPSSLVFSSDGTRSALEQVLPLLRDPKLTLSPEQLAQQDPLEWFKDGRLGMIAGYRSLVPELRATPTLDFDVLPMPVVDDAATLGDLTGVCISRGTPDLAESADFLVDFVSTESVRSVVHAGYLTPANTEVVLSEDFLQPDRRPVHAGVFVNSIRHTRIPPLLDDYDALEAAVADPIRALMEEELPDIEELTEQIDEASRRVLAPEELEEESPSDDSSDDSSD